jgi:hypothetical protein
MALLDKIKNDFTRHRKKAMVLGALAVVMFAFIGKAYFEMAPRNAAAAPTAATATPNPETVQAKAADSEENARQSQLLWKTLREKRGLSSDLAFTFESTFFNLNPKRKAAAPDRSELVDIQAKPAIDERQAELKRKQELVLAASRNLVVRSTVVGNNRPVAVINDMTVAGSDRILGVGDRINGFKITAIQAREVEFEKDGVTVAVEMARSK